ncbi:mogroside IE synthase-like [Malania oleifera]|uniref:mogroside IE synthase-like n=1 Tax=Malania oleifera TaxID=397392 RepID=UPI0025AE43EB|nr:mogroside IE synthase-like [Malania oleifera]XP_057975601.1 mogroside IE synthase-like [Malania oleifera]XP_057975602.1 mogroside IE synthase-like [Malania oleifera]
MEKERAYKAHVVAFPVHGQGHMNPMLQFCKRLASKGLKITVATTLSNTKSIQAASGSFTLEPIYDDCSEGGIVGPGGYKGFVERFKANGSQSLTELIKKLENSKYPVKGLIYDANLSWALDIARQLGLVGVAFFTQSCAAVASYYPMYYELLDEPLPVPPFSMPGLPKLGIPDLPSFGPDMGRFPPIIMYLLKQFDGIEKADWILFNSYDKLEEEVVKWMANLWPVMTIGPTVPSIYLDKRVKDDENYGFNLYKPNNDACIKWLNTKETGSVVYVSFGSAASLNAEQMTEMACALKHNNNNFLWVVKATEERMLPSNFVEETAGKGLVVTWCPQLEVLAHQAIGCFISHCGWNSTVEALSFGVPVVGMPQFLDQMVNAYFLEQVWGVGVKPSADEKGFVTGEEINRCIQEVINGERGQEIKSNAIRWKQLAKEAVDEGGSSDKHTDEIIARVVSS